MQTFVQDLQTVGEVLSVMFSTVQQGAVSAGVILQNRGTNTINYVFESFDGTNWNALDSLGTDYNNTLVAGQVRIFELAAAQSQVRLRANASGGSTLDFSLTRYFNRGDGGAVPLVTF